MPDPLTGEDAGVRDAGSMVGVDAGSLFVGRPQNPCADIEGWRTVSLAPNGMLTAANVSEVLKAVTRPRRPMGLDTLISVIARADRTKCTTGATTTGATTTCSCPDGGTVARAVTSTMVPPAAVILQCTVATLCGLDGRVIDGTSAQREVSRLVQGQERKEVTEAYRYTWQIAFDLGFYIELTGPVGGPQQVSSPRYAVPVAGGVVVVDVDYEAIDPPVTIIDVQGSWSCGALPSGLSTGSCQRGTTSVPWAIR